MQSIRRHHEDQSGFTLVELMVVIVIIAVLFALSTVNLGKPQSIASINTTLDTLISDIKSQQLLAMSGESGSQTSAQPHGVYFQSGHYILFADTSYTGVDSNNFSVDAAAGVSFTTTFPGDQVVFQKGDGAVNGFVSGDNTITLTGAGETKVVTIDRFGAITTN